MRAAAHFPAWGWAVLGVGAVGGLYLVLRKPPVDPAVEQRAKHEAAMAAANPAFQQLLAKAATNQPKATISVPLPQTAAPSLPAPTVLPPAQSGGIWYGVTYA